MLGGKLVVNRDYARDYISGGSGTDTIYVVRSYNYWKRSWTWEDRVTGGNKYRYYNFYI